MRSEVLSMVKDVECVDTEIECLVFCENYSLFGAQIHVNHAGPIEEAGFCETYLSQRLETELGSIKIGPIVRIAAQFERSGKNIRSIQASVESRWCAAFQTGESP